VMDRIDLSTIANNAKEQWRSLVIMALSVGEHALPSTASKVATSFGGTPMTVLLKMKAVRHAVACGMSSEQVVEMGQSLTLSKHAKARAEAIGPQRILSYRISRDLADAFECEHPEPGAPEPTCTRLHRVCGIESADDLIEFFKSVVDLASDEELRHQAGLIDKMRKMRRV
jgi:hypothetical protein